MVPKLSETRISISCLLFSSGLKCLPAHILIRLDEDSPWKWITVGKKFTRQMESSLSRVTLCIWMRCEVSSRMSMWNHLTSRKAEEWPLKHCHPIITASSKTSPLRTLLHTTRASNLWGISEKWKRVVESLIRRCNQLQLDPARVNREWLEHSDLSPLVRCWTNSVVLFVTSLAAFHLSLPSCLFRIF